MPEATPEPMPAAIPEAYRSLDQRLEKYVVSGSILGINVLMAKNGGNLAANWVKNDPNWPMARE
jgi:hypothetical protein